VTRRTAAPPRCNPIPRAANALVASAATSARLIDHPPARDVHQDAEGLSPQETARRQRSVCGVSGQVRATTSACAALRSAGPAEYRVGGLGAD